MYKTKDEKKIMISYYDFLKIIKNNLRVYSSMVEHLSSKQLM